MAGHVGWMQGLEAPALPQGDVFSSGAGSTPALRLWHTPGRAVLPSRAKLGFPGLHKLLSLS